MPVVAERAARGGGEGVSAKRTIVLGSSRRRAETVESSRVETPRPACRANPRSERPVVNPSDEDGAEQAGKKHLKHADSGMACSK